ncbi:MAG: conjugal transfer pilus assembly protein TraU [Rickettsiaceae bacterium]|nr:conjugal transfer pilus assembly protein TraU [Rickettsiaceae bacterium]
MKFSVKNIKPHILALLVICTLHNSAHSAAVGCTGRIVNPITDVCWSCLFPITVLGVEVVRGGPNTDPPELPLSPLPVCVCPRPGFPVPVPGVPIGFWEPVRLVDVTKAPMCMVGLGGITLGTTPQRGVKEDDDGSFYHVHWYTYPVLYWLELLLDFVCIEMSSVDLAYMTEFDPLWGDDIKSTIINPESLLFGNQIAIAACTADCLMSSVGLSNDWMFWCAGCQGGFYPLSGTTSYHNGGVGSAQLTVSKFMAKMHRQLMLWGYYGAPGMCGKYPMPVIKKSQYRMQMTFPIPEIISCKRIGQTELLWQAGKEFPIWGEDFGFLIWRKRDCCLL